MHRALQKKHSFVTYLKFSAVLGTSYIYETDNQGIRNRAASRCVPLSVISCTHFLPFFPPMEISKKHFGPDIITIVIDRFQMEEVESTFSKPPIYYKDFGTVQ